MKVLKFLSKKSSVEIASDIKALRDEHSTVSASIEAVICGDESPEKAADKIVKMRSKAEILAARISQRETDLAAAKVDEAKQEYAELNAAYLKAVAAFDKGKAEYLNQLLKSHEIRTAKRLHKLKALWPIVMTDLRLAKRVATEKLQTAAIRLRDMGVFDAAVPPSDQSDDDESVS